MISLDAEFHLTLIKLKDFLYTVIKSFGISRSLPNSDDFVCQIESGLTEVYCIKYCITVRKLA